MAATNSTSTVIEGDFEKVMQAVKKMHQAPFDKGCARVITSITIDERRDKPATMETTVEAVMEELH